MTLDVSEFDSNAFSLPELVRKSVEAADWLIESDRGMVALAMKAAYNIENLEDIGEPQKAVYAVPHLNACLVQLGLSPVSRNALKLRESDDEDPLKKMQAERDSGSDGAGGQ